MASSFTVSPRISGSGRGLLRRVVCLVRREELVELRRKGIRFIALADDNFYPVTLDDLEHARSRGQYERLAELERLRKLYADDTMQEVAAMSHPDFEQVRLARVYPPIPREFASEEHLK